MSDTIYRQEAIDAIYEHEFSNWCDKDEVSTILNDLPSADRPQEWIPCSEREPKGQGYYICTCKDGSKYKRATVVKWSNGWKLTGSRTYWVVVAWMPLPEPWKGADDD